MHTENNGEALSDDKAAEPTNEMEESTLNWLLDMDRSEPEESLFAVDQTPQADTDLTEDELAVARRPMTRGTAGVDDLEQYIGEEIVMSSDTESNDIYASSEMSPSTVDGDEGVAGPMAIDYSREPRGHLSTSDGNVSEGSDILGLAEDDDIGEKFLVIKRVEPSLPAAAGGEAGSINSSAEAGPVTTEADASDTLLTGGLAPEEPGNIEEETPQESPQVLGDAPVLRLVSAISPLIVANDVPADLQESVDIESTAASSSEAPADVSEYIAGTTPPTDEEEFDNYLLNGEQLPDGEPSPHELSLLPLEGEASYDADSDDTIDYHEDFQQAQGSAGEAAANITPLVPELIAELTLVINERLASLGMAADSVQAELMLESDSTSAEEILAGGFEPMVAVCPAPLVILQQMRQVDVDAIYVGLLHTESGERCNRLFDENFVLGITGECQPADGGIDDTFEGFDGLDIEEGSMEMLAEDDQLESSGSELADSFAVEMLAEDDQLESSGSELADSFAVEMLAEDDQLESSGSELADSFAVEMLAEEDQPGVSDSELDDSLAVEMLAEDDQLESSGSELADSFAVEMLAEDDQPGISDSELDDSFAVEMLAEDDQPGISDSELDDSFAVEMLAEEDQPGISDSELDDSLAVEMLAEDDQLESSDADSEDNFAGFGEDIFADELTAGGGEAAQTDIDALFDSLGLVTDEADEICGLDVQEFSSANETVQLVPPVEQPAADIAAELAVPLESSEPVEPTKPVDAGEFNCIPAGITFSHASPGGGEIFADFLDAFVEEGSSELEKLEDAVAVWEREVASEEAYAVVGRVLHTIKGIAKGVGLHFYGTLVHNFETLLGAMPRPEVGAESEYFRTVNAWLDACVRGLDHIQDARADILNVLPQTADQAAAGQPAEAEDVVEPVQVEATPEPAPPVVDTHARKQSKKIADDGAKALAAQQSVRITSEKLDDMLNLSNQAQQLSVRTAQSVTRGKRASLEMQHRLASVRAHISGIADRALRSVAARGVQPGAAMDALEMDQYSELQEAANILREGVEDLADLVDFATRQNTQIEALLKHQTNVISSIGTSIRAARVVPVSRLIPGLRRLVRTVSVDLNKTVTFQVLNELGTLDRDDYARCQTILDHMVRNALDHGIEPADERTAAGKPVEGLITVDIRKAGADTVITLADDGRGIHPAKMRESAIAKGLDMDVDALTDEEAVRLVFHKGFSTANSVSQISGRGVGMDIVLTELQEMGGDIQIESIPGRGASFHIRVPSSITVNGALLVSAGEQSYAIPLGGLIAVEQVPVEEFFSAVQDHTRLSLAGMECEPAYLATLCHTGHSLDAKTWRTSVPVVIAGPPERRMAIAVDDFEEALELVIRSLGTQFSAVPGVAGAATTAAGEAIVALDLNLLVASVGADDQSPLHVDPDREEALLVMVVDDSRTQRMVATSQLETVGVETMTAENGGVAIDMLNSADRLPDIILMDVEMPVKDGIQALREIRKSVRYAHVPVIMITSRTGLKHRAMAQAAGCNGYMGKPFNFRMLIGQINELTGHRLQLS